MEDKIRVRIEAGGRCIQWRDTNTGLIMVPSVLHTKFTAFETLYNDIQAIAGAQLAIKEVASGETVAKSGDIESVRDICGDMADIAAAMEPDFAGMQAKYHFRRNMSAQDTLATARAFAANAVADEAHFIAHGMPATFLADLGAAADTFETSIGDTGSARSEGVGKTAELKAKTAELMKQKRTIDLMIKVMFKSNTAALNSWRSAAHVEVLNGKPTPPTPPTP